MPTLGFLGTVCGGEVRGGDHACSYTGMRRAERPHDGKQAMGPRPAWSRALVYHFLLPPERPPVRALDRGSQAPLQRERGLEQELFTIGIAGEDRRDG
jgi:hypothetical protein